MSHLAPHCGPHDEHCITCGDEASPMRVLSVDRADGLAVCRHEDGSERVVEVGLVEPVARGDVVLVHADVALATVEQDAR